MLQEIDQLTPENLAQHTKRIQLMLELLVGISEVEQLYPPTSASVSKEPETFNSERADRLVRMLRNGRLEKLNVFVPEKEIRKNGWENGDYLEADRIFGTNYHNFRLVKKAPLPTNRIEKQMLIVEKSPLDELIVNIFSPDFDLEMPVSLSKQDIEKFHISEGDCIDYAYHQEAMTQGLVIWKHPIEALQEAPVKVLPAKQKKKDTVESALELSNIEGKTILMVGSPTAKMRNSNAGEIEKRKGKFLFIAADESTARIREFVEESDVVIDYTGHISHGVMWSVRSSAKEFEKPIYFTHEMGTISFLRKCEELLLEKEQIFREELDFFSEEEE